MRQDDQREMEPAARGTTRAWSQVALPLLLAALAIGLTPVPSVPLLGTEGRVNSNARPLSPLGERGQGVVGQGPFRVDCKESSGTRH
jgi:hypothetical protein